jgi:hypothetical protein
MTCEKCMDRYLSLDNGEALPRGIRAHVAGCNRCMTEIRGFEALREEMTSLPPESDRDLADEVMMNIRRLSPDRQTVSTGRWLAVGITLLLSVALVPLGRSYLWVRQTWGMSFDLPLFLVLGIVFVLYCTVFIAVHVDELSHRFKILDAFLK